MEQNSKKPSSRSSLKKETVFGNPYDGKLSVWLSKTALEAFADFIPPEAGGHPLLIEDIEPILEKVNVKYGIKWENIKAALRKCNIERETVSEVLVAMGDLPENEITEYYKKSPELDGEKWQDDGKSRIDHRERSPFTIVKKNQVLANLIPKKPGKEGKNVHGEALPYGLTRPESVEGGVNTRTENETILSNIDGQFVQVKKILSVQDTLIIKGSVGYATGNIAFPGDIRIDGLVADGFKIYSGGSITIKQTFDVTEAVTKKDLLVSGGIIGKGTAVLKVGGSIRTKFIANCRAAARDSIYVEKEINNSSVYTLKTIEMADKGVILGSRIYSVHGIKAGEIGKKANKATHIHCGVDFIVQQEKEKCTNELRTLAGKIAKLKGVLNSPTIKPNEKASATDFLQRLEEEQAKTSKHMAALTSKVNVNENAAVEVTGGISKGTIIEICQVALFIDSPMRKVRIRLDKIAGRLVAEPL